MPEKRPPDQSRDPPRRRAPSAVAARSGPLNAKDFGSPRVESLALLILLALIPLRAVLAETHTFEIARSFRTLDAPGGASPATTFALCAVIFGVAALVAFTRLWSGGPHYQRTGAEAGAIILIIALAISTWRAGQTHLAIIGSLDFLALLVYLITLPQLLRRPWQIRLALTVILSAGGMMLAKCAYQRWVEWPETLKYYQAHKAELLASNQSSPGFIFDYEQRLKGGSLTGYFNHPNVLASFLILVIFAALAVARSRWRRRPAWTLAPPVLIAVLGFTALVGAQSKGAVAALMIGFLVWLAAWALRSALRRAPLKGVAIVWMALLAGAVALAVTLHYKPTALGLSMLYRSFYWRASVAMVRDQGPWGVGANNFGRFFTRYKDVACPEDVEDPHSWPVRALTEWGVLGLAGMLVVFIGVSKRLASMAQVGGSRASMAHAGSPGGATVNSPGRKPWVPRGHDDPALEGRQNARDGRIQPSNAPTDRNVLDYASLASRARHRNDSIILWAAAIALLFTLGWFSTLAGTSAAFLLLTLVMPLWVWFVTFFATGYEPAEGMRFLDDDFGPLLPPLCAGLIAFLIHSGIDLAMFQGGPATTFFAIVAIAIAARGSLVRESLLAPSPAGIPSHKTRRFAAVIAGITGGALTLMVLLGLVLPTTVYAKYLRWARLPTKPVDVQIGNYHDAIGEYRFDATALDELADELSRRAQSVEQVEAILALIDEFERRDPHNALVPHHRATLHYARFEIARRSALTSSPSGPQASSLKSQAHLSDLNKAVEYMRQSVAMYPTNPTRRLFLADLLEKRAGVEEDAAAKKRLLTQAADELQTALDLDARRIYVSPLHHMSDATRAQAGERIHSLMTH